MHTIEPFYNWVNLYVASEDDRSPFYKREYSEFEFVNTVYNYFIHPQWDEFGSDTLYLKILYADYNRHFCIIELLGEWNDLLYNDIMFLKRNVIECLIENGIKYFILIGENILNFHASDDAYYQEWFEEIEEGWIACVNFRKHVIDEFVANKLDYYMGFGGLLDNLYWRTDSPLSIFEKVFLLLSRRLNYPEND